MEKEEVIFTEEEAKKRMKRVVAIHEHEGLTVTQETQDSVLKILRGELVASEVIDKLKESYK